MSHSTDPPARAMAADVDGTRPPESVRRLAYCSVTTAETDRGTIGDLAPSDPVDIARSIRSHDRITEAVVLATCNRVEVYVSVRRPADREDALRMARRVVGSGAETREAVGREVVEHLSRVACGLDSEILGEDHVLGQVDRAFEAAADAGLAGGILSRVADAAASVGREVRAETAINEGHSGYGGATCAAIAESAGSPGRVVVVGAGDVAEDVVRAAERRWDARIDVVNRSPARDLPTEDGTYWPLSALSDALAGADAVVTATAAPRVVLATRHAAALDAGTTIVDLATPPDVADGVADAHPVTTLAEIEKRVDADTARRRAAESRVESMCGAAVERFLARERESRAEDTIRELHREAAAIRSSEVARAERRLAAGDADAEDVLEDFASALTSRLLAQPTAQLKAAARDGDDRTVAAADRLFDLSGGEGE